MLLLSSQIKAQTGVSFTAGLALSKNQLSEITPENATNGGYSAAIEGRFLGEGMFFVLQLQYAKYRLLADDGVQFSIPDNNIQVGYFRVGMGFTLLRFGNLGLLRAKVLGSLDKTIQYTSKALVDTNYNRINDSTVGIVGGIGLDLKWFVLDVEFEKGLINAFYKVKESNFNYFSVRAGFLIK